MKCPLFILFIFISSSLFAQYDISVGMGSSHNSVLVKAGYVQKSAPHERFMPYLSVRGSYNTHRWQVGVATGMGAFSGRYQANEMMYPSIYPFPKTEEEKRVNAWAVFNVTNPVYSFLYAPILAFVNIKAKIGQATVYGGVAAGGNAIVTRGLDDRGFIKGENDLRISGAFGTQAGVRIPVAERFAFNTEVAVQYMSYGRRTFVLTIPMTAGLTYAF